MIRARLLLRLFLIFAPTVACSGSTDDPPSDKPADSVQAEVERRIHEAADAGFTGAILVTVDGQRLLATGHGMADRQNQVPNGPETAFDVGSIMKTLTVVALYRLAEDKKLALTNTLAELLPDVPPDKAEITLLQIVQHSAGFGEYHDTMGDFEPMTRLEARGRILEQALLFEPGSDEAYSNSGYTLLADIIEAVSGSTFQDYVRQTVLEPAGMDHSGFYSDALWQRVDTAIGYDAAVFGQNDPATWPYTWALVGNGGLVSTVIDLERFQVALFDGGLLSNQAQAALHDEVLALGAAELAGETVYAEAGAGDYGLGGVVLVAPARGTRVAIASNANTAFDVETFAVDLMNFLLEET